MKNDDDTVVGETTHTRPSDRPTVAGSSARLVQRRRLSGSPPASKERMQLRTLHSSGGIGEVWVAYDSLLEREVALKRLKLEQSDHEELRARFFREARITGQLEHPGIVPVYDFEAADGSRCFYTMRLVGGRNLREVTRAFHARRRRDDGPLVCGDFLQLLRDFTSVCDTVAFAHSRRIIHRDIKGDNVVVGDFGEVILLDWGLAKHIEAPELPLGDGGALEGDIDATVEGQQLGTPSYMAPEQARGALQDIDERTDVYGLSAILYEILTGRPPFSGQSAEEIMEAVLEQPPKPPAERFPDVPPELQDVCLRGLSKDPADRPQSAQAMGDAVRGWLNALAETRRQEREREYFFGVSIDLLVLLDGGGHVVQSNPAWRDAFGDDRDDSRAREFAAFFHEEDRAAVRGAVSEARDGRPAASFDARMHAVDGTVRWVNWNLTPAPESSQLYLVGRDVTDLKRSERLFRGLLEFAPDATCVVDASGAITRVNAMMEQVFGYDRAELIGQPVGLLVPDAHRPGHADLVADYATKPRPRAMGTGRNLRGRRKDGSTIQVEISLGPLRVDDELMVVCSVREARRHGPADDG